MNSLLRKNNPASKPLMYLSKAKPVVQPKFIINEPGNQYEHEADAMANKVMGMVANETYSQPKPITGLVGRSVQRKCSKCEEEEKKKRIMRKPEAANTGIQISSSFASSLSASKGGGATIPKETRRFMENAFSTDFSRVKIHTGGQASEMSNGINAKAFTYGNDIYFKEGEYNPSSSIGLHLLAHELTHVVQQGGSQMKVQRQVAHTFTFISRESYGETTPNITRPSCGPGATAGTSTLVAGSAAPTVAVFPNGTYQVRRDDGLVQTATCTRLAAGLAATQTHENHHVAGVLAGVAAANSAASLPLNFATPALCAAALPGILTTWNASVRAVLTNEAIHGPGTDPPTAQTFSQENAAGTCTFV
jgi:hypothetical protein